MPSPPKYPKSAISTLPLHGVANVTSFKDEKPMTSVAGGNTKVADKKEEKPIWNPPLAETITPFMPFPPSAEDLPVKTAEELEAIKNPPVRDTTSSTTPSYMTPGSAIDDDDYAMYSQFWGF